ncbi:MAG: glycosyltransferase [Catalinimonas sp.]
MFYSFIVPVYNRPEEVRALLESLTRQTYRPFEVLVIEDGSDVPAEAVVAAFREKLDVHYHLKPNSGQGFSRNWGFERARGDYFVVLDSDVLLDPDYLENLHAHLQSDPLDAFGGPDRQQPDATPVQRAIDYCMTSPLTTGGIRGGKKQVDKFYPRSFNMGFSRAVWEATGGFRLPYLGEDLEMSRRIMSLGFRTGLVPTAHVYHKRKETFGGFWRQIHFFGRARVNMYKLFPDTLKVPHLIPAGYLLYLGAALPAAVLSPRRGGRLLVPWLLYEGLIFAHATAGKRSVQVGLLSAWAVNLQMCAYGAGFLQDFVKRVVLERPHDEA